MAPAVAPHHHRSTTKASHKPFKSRHATKGFLKDLSKGRTDGDRGKRSTKTLHQQVMSKIDRRHQARQRQQAKHLEHVRSTNLFSGHNGAPRNVAIVPLSEGGDARAAIKKLNWGLDLDNDIPATGHVRQRIERFKQNIQYIPVQRDLLDALDACKVADFVLFILSPTEEVDQKGELLIRVIESQGVSNIFTVVQGLDAVEPPKRRPQVTASLKSYISHFFPDQEKIHSLDSYQDCANLVRSLCTTTPRGVRWREDRTWIHVEDIQWPPNTAQGADRAVILTGVVRGKNLKSNRLLQVGDWGPYQISKVTAAPLAIGKKRKLDEMVVDDALVEDIIDQPDEHQDSLEDIAPEEVEMNNQDFPAVESAVEKRGVLLDDHHYFSDDETHLPEAPKRLPKGTSSYQAAWFLGDMSDSGSGYEDEADGDVDMSTGAPALPQDGLEGLDQVTRDATEFPASEYPQSEMFLDPSPQDEAEALQAYRLGKKTEAEDDLEFPDEIELHPGVLARERLARYRGLKSLRTSKWETSEDRAHEPEDWNRLLQISNYKAAKSQAFSEALVGGVSPGTRVHIYLRDVPLSLRGTSTSVLTAISLLRHEQKRAVMNFTFTLSSDYPSPIKSKEEMIMQCGPRRSVINPLFSQTGNTPNNVHKFARYVHPGQTVMATFIAPLTWGSVPTLFFKQSQVVDDECKSTPPLVLIGTGTSLPADFGRVITKRVILTGHPYKIHKKLVTVRYMFFNKEDVQWFKALQLWTKRGRSGYIKESLGTHGYFKATFDAKINPQDSVGVSLYKRVWPRTSSVWRRGVTDESATVGENTEIQMEE